MITKWSEGDADVNMDEDILVELSQTIHRHPWWRARASLTIALLKRLGVNRSARVLDAGCGWGVTLSLLERCGYRADGLDISRRALDQLDRPGRLLIEADLAQPLADRFEPYDAFDLVRATVADFTEHAEAQGFSVEADLVTPEGAFTSTIRVDEEAFRRAVRNLLDNAVKYSPVCRTVWVDGTICDRRVLISVRDQGMGINAEEKQAIFQKFVRGQAAKKAGIKGTGIGLAMVRQISEAMGGEIRVQSEVGVGSTFTLVLPLAED